MLNLTFQLIYTIIKVSSVTCHKYQVTYGSQAYTTSVLQRTIPPAMKVEQVIHARCPDPKEPNKETYDCVVVWPLEERINICVLPFWVR